MSVFKWDWTDHLTPEELKKLKDSERPSKLTQKVGFEIHGDQVERVHMTKEELKRINEEQDELLEAKK
jgi:hypothetical protein